MPTPTPGHYSVIVCHVDMWLRVLISSTPRGLAAAKVGLVAVATSTPSWLLLAPLIVYVCSLGATMIRWAQTQG